MIKSHFVGQLTFDEGLRAQQELAVLAEQRGEGFILGLEHAPVITLGRRGKASEDLIESKESIEARGFEIRTADRGGQATLHNPGQLVIYPILPIKAWGIGVREYVEKLQQATVQFFADLGLQTHVKCDDPGVYTKRGKIAFFGVRVQHGVTGHGLAINIKNNLTDFRFIRSCGSESQRFDSFENYSTELILKDLFERWVFKYTA